MRNRRLWIGAALLLMLVTLFSVAAADDLFSLSKTGTVEETWYIPGGGTGDYLLGRLLRDEYCQINSYDSSLGEPQWTLTQTSGSENILRIKNGSANDYYLYIEFGVAYPPVGDYSYTLSCTWRGETQSVDYVVHMVEVDFPSGVIVEEVVEVPLNGTTNVTPSLNPEGWSLPGETASWTCIVTIGGSNYGMGEMDTLYATVEDSTFTFTGKVPGYYRVEYYYQCANIYMYASGYVIVLNEDGSRPEFEFTISKYTDRETFYLRDNTSYNGNSLGGFSVSTNIYVNNEYITWTLTQTSGPVDAVTLSLNSWNYSRGSLNWEVERPTLGIYEYELSCKVFETTKTETIRFTVADPPMGSLKGISVPDIVEVPLNETATVTLTLDPEGWYIPDETPNIYCFIYFNGEGYYNGDENYLKAEVENGTFTFTGVEPGYYEVEYVYDCAGLYRYALGEAIVLQEDGSHPGYDFSFNKDDLVTTYYIQDNYNYYQENLPDGYYYLTVGASVYDLDPVWTLTKISGDTDVLQFEDTNDKDYRCVEFSQETLTPGTYEYEISCTIRGTTRTRHITLTIAYPPNGPLEGLTEPGELTLRVGATGAVQIGKVPANWTLPGETENWYCQVMRQGSGWSYYNGIPNYLTAEVDQETGVFTFTAFEPGYYTVYYYYYCSNFSAGISGEVIVLNEDGTYPEYNFSLNQDDLVTTYYIQDNGSYYETDLPNAYTSVSNSVENQDVVWTLTKISGDADILQFEGTNENNYRYVEFSRNTLTPGTYEYDVSCTIRGITRTRHITLTIAYPPYGPLEGLATPENLTLGVGETGTVQIGKLPADWTLPGETESWYCDVMGQGFGWYYNGISNYLTAEVDQETGTFTFTAFEPGYYTVYYYYYCSNFSAGISGEVIVLNEDGSLPEFDFSLGYTAERTVYRLSPNMLSNSVTNGYIGINNYTNRDGKPVEWSLNFISGPEDAIQFQTYYYSNWYSYEGYLEWKVDEPAVGDYVYEMACTWMGATRTAEITVHLLESPNGYLEGIDVPDEIRVRAGESTTYTGRLNPDGWSVPGYTGYWSATLYGNNYDWMSWQNDYVCLSIDQTTGVYTFTGVTPGYYSVYIGYSVNQGRLYTGETIPLIVLNEDGSVPPFVLSLYHDELEMNYYLTPDGNHMQSYVSGGWNGISNYTYSEDMPEWNFTMVSGPSDAFYISPYDGNRSIDLYAKGVPAEGDYVYCLTCVWKDSEATADYTIHVKALDQAINGIVGDTELRVEPNAAAKRFDFTLDPADLGVNDENEGGYWNLHFRVPGENYDTSSSSYFKVNNYDNSGTLYVSGYVPGVYRGYLSYEVGNIYVSKNVKLIVMNEDGTEPEEPLVLEGGLNYSTLNVDPERTSYINNTIAWLRLEEYDEEEVMVNQPVWTLQAPEGQESLYKLQGYDYNCYVNVLFAEEPQEEGTYTFTITCSWNGQSESRTYEYEVLRFIAPDSVTCDMESSYMLHLGDTITLNKPLVTPSDWTWKGQGATIGYRWYMEGTGGSTNAIALTAEDEDTVSLSVSQTGSYEFQYYVNCGSYTNYFYTTLIVLDEDGTVDLPARSYGSGSEEAPSYLNADENWIGYVYLSNYNTYAAIFEGEPQLTYTTEPADADIRIESYDFSFNWWEKGFYLVPTAEEDQQVTVNWTVTWGDANKSGSFTSWLKVPEKGILKGLTLDCGDELTVAAGTPVTVHATTDPVGWKADGSTAAPTLRIYSLTDEDAFEVEEQGELYARIRFDEPGWYGFEAYIGGNGSYQWRNVVVKVTDASGNLADPEDIVFDFSDMRETYTLGQKVYANYRWRNNIGTDDLSIGWTLNSNAFEPNWNWDEEIGEYFVPTEIGTYQVTITLKDLLGRTAVGTYSFQVTDPEPLSFTGITVEGVEEGLRVTLQTSGGASDPSYRIDLYRGVNNGVRAGMSYETDKTFSSLADGLYQVVARVSDSETSITRVTGFYRVSGGNVSAVSGTMKLPGGLKEIEAEAFQGITSGTVICPNGMTAIGASAFSGSTVTRIEIPASVTSIASSAFSGATRYLTVVTTAGSAAETWAKANGYIVEYK